MVLNGKNGGFFLDLDSSDAQPVTLDLGPDKEPEETTPEEPSSPMTLTVSKADDSASSSDGKVASDGNATTSSAPAATAPSTSTPEKPAQDKPFLTTAEAIAAELAAAEAARPTASLTTFAPDNLVPGKALRQRRRRPGSNLKGFKSMAGDLFKN